MCAMENRYDLPLIPVSIIGYCQLINLFSHMGIYYTVAELSSLFTQCILERDVPPARGKI